MTGNVEESVQYIGQNFLELRKVYRKLGPIYLHWEKSRISHTINGIGLMKDIPHLHVLHTF